MKCTGYALILSALALGACAPKGEYPSLAKRPFETAAPAEVAAPPVAQLRSDPESLARVNASVARAQATVIPFERELTRVTPLVAAASGASIGSERWIDGQMAASRLEPLHGPAVAALSDIDVEVRAAILDPLSADREAILTSMAEVTAIVERQKSQIDVLTKRLAR